MYEDWDEEDYLEEEEEIQYSRAAERRKNEWKYARRNQKIVESMNGYEMGGYEKPLHYYSKTAPEYYYQRRNKTNNKGKHRTAYGNYNPQKNWSSTDRRKINNYENQLEELFDEE